MPALASLLSSPLTSFLLTPHGGKVDISGHILLGTEYVLSCKCPCLLALFARLDAIVSATGRALSPLVSSALLCKSTCSPSGNRNLRRRTCPCPGPRQARLFLCGQEPHPPKPGVSRLTRPCTLPYQVCTNKPRSSSEGHVSLLKSFNPQGSISDGRRLGPLPSSLVLAFSLSPRPVFPSFCTLLSLRVIPTVRQVHGLSHRHRIEPAYLSVVYSGEHLAHPT